MWSWQHFAFGVDVAALVWLLARWKGWDRLAPYALETAVVCELYAVWQVVLGIVVVNTSGAYANARGLWRVERDLRLPSEATLQHAALTHTRWLVQASNLFYETFHFPALIAALILLFVRRRDRFRWARTTLILSTGASAFIQAIPFAPPRLVSGIGMVDAGQLLGQTVYDTAGAGDAGQLTAMPSVHCLWAFMVAVIVVTALRSPWRWLIVLYPIVTTLVVVLTGNHYWGDSIVGGLLVAAGGVVAAAWERRDGRVTSPGWAPVRSVPARA